MADIQIIDKSIYREASSLLESIYGKGALFRDGQYEAIEATMLHRRTLVVQRTGWGKSLVYFMCTKINRNAGKGVTFVVSPLLVLMENQIEAAAALGLRCEMLNSQTKDRRSEILQAIIDNKVDLVLVTPETLFNDEVQAALKDIIIGLFVIDEAHCISDWGHDFRLEYCRLKEVISGMAASVPILCTTATANDRVVADLKEQLGGDVYISRGPLSRESLWIQTLELNDRESRYAWLLENLPKLPGTGIVYCLTQRDCDYLSEFLNQNGIPTLAYYSRSGEEDLKNRAAMEAFQNNEIKALVATVKLGMGYDKGDISFVIHFQMPANIVSYYQQIGRAGRNIPRAYAVLMSGEEDENILDYFIETAFPSESEIESILRVIRDKEGAGLFQLTASLNIRYSRIEKALSFLVNDGFIRKEGSKYYLTPKKFVYNGAHYEAIKRTRYTEKEQMKGLLSTNMCLSRYIVSCLDDTADDCRHCPNCLQKNILPANPGYAAIEIAAEYLGNLKFDIEPKKRWPAFGDQGARKIDLQNKVGICLSKYGDPGYGTLVKLGKYPENRSEKPRFCDELVGKTASVLRPFIKDHNITAITWVPSLRSNIVSDFAQRLGAALKLPAVDLLEKSSARQQKEMENSAFQYYNAWKSFSAKEAEMPDRVLLVDDMVDSGWTLAVCGYRLMEAGCEEVYPFALADSGKRGN